MSINILQPPVAEVLMIDWPAHAMTTLAEVCTMFQGEKAPKLTLPEHWRQAENDVLKQLQNTALRGPLEMLNFTFKISRVTRAFTHQLVRYRIGTSFAQESLRFSKKMDAEVLCTIPRGNTPEYGWFMKSATEAIEGYQRLLALGVPAEDARGILPTNILTTIYFHTSFRTLINIWEQRMCTQAQHGEWGAVLAGIKREILQKVDRRLGDLLQLRCNSTGVCMFHSDWDRACWIRESLKEPERLEDPR